MLFAVRPVLPTPPDAVPAFPPAGAHPEYWLPDGDVVFDAGDTLFCVHRARLALVSPFFEGMFALPQSASTLSEQETCAGRPLIRAPDAAEDVEVFLRAIYDERMCSLPLSLPTLTSLLHLATKYAAPPLLALAHTALRARFPRTLAAHQRRAFRLVHAHTPRDLDRLVHNARTAGMDAVVPGMLLDRACLATAWSINGHAAGEGDKAAGHGEGDDEDAVCSAIQAHLEDAALTFLGAATTPSTCPREASCLRAVVALAVERCMADPAELARFALAPGSSIEQDLHAFSPSSTPASTPDSAFPPGGDSDGYFGACAPALSLSGGVCWECKGAWRAGRRQLAEECWEHLPGWIGLPRWDEMSEAAEEW